MVSRDWSWRFCRRRGSSGRDWRDEKRTGNETALNDKRRNNSTEAIWRRPFDATKTPLRDVAHINEQARWDRHQAYAGFFNLSNYANPPQRQIRKPAGGLYAEFIMASVCFNLNTTQAP